MTIKSITVIVHCYISVTFSVSSALKQQGTVEALAVFTCNQLILIRWTA